MARLQLTRLSLRRPPDGGSFVGDPCSVRGCDGVLGVYSVRHQGGMTIRYLSCNDCGWRPPDNKFVVKDTSKKRDADGQKMLFESDDGCSGATPVPPG